jgi:hypothetical protein
VVIGRLKTVCSRKDLSQFCRIVNQDGEMLRTDEEPGTLVFERDKGNLIRVPVADQTSSLVSGHAHFSRFDGGSGLKRSHRKIDSDRKINKGRIVSART